ncbi:MAG: hypothetical protein PUP93_08365 [Rhizonema sp. NSF051]|nr:hypothetical protein [Rhizonema sp. NSF051]
MQYVKTADSQWLFTEIEGESATLSLQTIEFQIQLSDLYEQVNFADSVDNIEE